MLNTSEFLDELIIVTCT